MPESPTDRGTRPVVHTAAPTSSSPPADAFASAPYPLFATGSYDPGEYDYPPPLLYGPLLRPMRNPLQPLSAASTVRPTSSRPPAAVAKPVRAANGAPTPAAEFPSTLTVRLGKLEVQARPQEVVAVEGGGEVEGDEAGEAQGAGKTADTVSRTGKKGETDWDAESSGSDGSGGSEMDVEDDKRQQDPTVAPPYRPFTFRRPSLVGAVGFEVTVPVGLRQGPLTADELPPLPNGVKGGTALVQRLLSRNEQQHRFNLLPAATLHNATLYDSVSCTLPLPFVSTTAALQPPTSTRLNIELAQGKHAFLPYYTYTLSAYVKSIDEAEQWLAFLKQPEIVARAERFGFGVYLAEYIRGVGRFRDQGGWGGNRKRLVEYVGRSDGWDHPDPSKENALRPLAHLVGPSAQPKTFVQLVLQILRAFRTQQPDDAVEVYLSFGGTAGELDRSISYKLIQEVEALIIIGRMSAVTLGGANIAPGGDVATNPLVAKVLRSRGKGQSLALLDDGSSPIPGCSPSAVLIAAQAVERKRSKGVVDPYGAALESAEKEHQAGAHAPQQGEKQAGITGQRFAVNEASAPPSSAKRRRARSPRDDDDDERDEGKDELSEGEDERERELDGSEDEDEAGERAVQQGSGGGATGKPRLALQRYLGFEKELADLSEAHQLRVRPFAQDPFFKLLCGKFFGRKKAFQPTIVTRESIHDGVEVVCKNRVLKHVETADSYYCEFSLVVFDGPNIAEFSFQPVTVDKLEVMQISWDPRLKLLLFRDDEGDSVMQRRTAVADELVEMTWTVDDFLKRSRPLVRNARVGESQAAAKERRDANEAERKRVARAFFA